ncbi:MAG TPA: FAD-dependent monooxygenase [Rubrobacteraceae bacterium]|nr:FAD-dependent monooxygenase [Rubrobacteraceae bacterium]
MKAIIVGGGIGGLSTAIALRRAGVEAAVFERAPGPREVGAAVGLWSNAVLVLKSLGLYASVRALGAEIGAEIRSWRGRKLFELSAEELRERYGEANLLVHRAHLQSALLSTLPEETVRFGAHCVSFSQDGAGVTARFADGRTERGDLLVGADGLRSNVRASLLDDGPPRYAGLTAWRGIALSAEGFAPEKAGLELWGRGTEVGVMSLGGGRAYWYATKNVPEGAAESPAGRKREVLDLLRGWYGPARAAVEATEDAKILRTDIYDREPANRRWGEGRVTLLGDAAHPMTPHLGQGACQAIEDAAVLADCLRDAEGAPAAALRRYEVRRAPRTATIVRNSRRTGRLLQFENPLLCGLRDSLVGAFPQSLLLRQMDRVIGYKV